MGGGGHQKAKGKGKGKLVSKGKNNTARDNVTTEPSYEIKETRIDLKDESQDEVLTLIQQLTDVRDAARHKDHVKKQEDLGSESDDEEVLYAPIVEASASPPVRARRWQRHGATTKTDGAMEDQTDRGHDHQESEDEEDDEGDDDGDREIVPWGYGEANDEPKKGTTSNKRTKKLLLRQLLAEEQRQAATPKATKKAGHGINICVAEASAMHLEPIQIKVSSGGPGEVDKFLKTVREPLGIKGKTPLNAYLVSPDGKPCAKLVKTSDLVEGQLIAVSTRDLPVSKHEGPVEATQEKVIECEKILDVVRAAYAKRARRESSSNSVFSPLPREEVQLLNTTLLDQSRTYAADDAHRTMREVRAALPAAAARRQLQRALELSQVVIVVGETGSGKTTQCPNFILEDASSVCRGGEVSIVCTQPRRIAAVSVATRVAHERGEEPGGTVGYAVRLDSKVSRSTRLLFCTTGVLLQQLNVSPDLTGVTHIVVDEAHERNLHTDFLLALLRDLLERRADLRVIVMSATLEQGLFASYFEGFAFDPSESIPVVQIAGRTHPLTIRYLNEVCASAGVEDRRQIQTEDVDQDFDSWIRQAHPRARIDGGNNILVSPAVKQKTDYDLIAHLCAAILLGNLGPDGGARPDDGAILIFLPGYVEIERCLRTLQSHPGCTLAHILPLHGSLPISDQQRVFLRPPMGLRKIIVSTNIAETSVTIDDVTHVIDSGHVRETRYNPRSSMTVFSTVWVSKAAAQQRAGRASRVRPGVCWRLYERVFMETKLPAHTLCEMRRTALEDLVLQLRLLELGDEAGEFLQKAPEPPTPESVAVAVQSLVAIGALVNTLGLPLTPLGFHLAHMPVDARVGKMLVFGALCCCLAPVLTIAACLAHRSPFSRNFNKQREDQQRRAREKRFGELCSDHLAALGAFNAYEAAKACGNAEVTQLCDELGLSTHAMLGISQLRERFLRHLVDIGFAKPDGEDGGNGVNSHRNDLTLVRCVLTAGLFPNVVQVQRQTGRGRGNAKTVFVSKERERCAVHPSSINCHRTDDFAANSSWLVFNVKLKTSQIFIQDSTLVGSIPLLLFGGELRLNKGLTQIFLGDLPFKTRKEATAVLLKLMRREVDQLLLAKVADPSTDISEQVSPLLETILHLLRLDGCAVSGQWRS